MPDKIARIDPFPPSPEGRKAASKEAVDLDAYKPSFGNFTTDRGNVAADEPGEWNPEVIGARGAWRGFMNSAQTPGGKPSKDRVSY